MKKNLMFAVVCACSLMLMACSLPVMAQAAPAKRPVNELLDFWISNTERDVVGAADAMPEDKYEFAPTAEGFAGVRTFAQQVKHLSANNYRMAAHILGQKPTADQESETGPDTGWCIRPE